MWEGGGRGRDNHGVGQAYYFLEKWGGPKENFTMFGGGSFCVLSHSLQFMWKVYINSNACWT